MNNNMMFIKLTKRANEFDQKSMNKLHNEYSNETDMKQDFNDDLINF